MVLTGSAPADARSACGRRFLELCSWAATTSLDAVPAQVRRRASLIFRTISPPSSRRRPSRKWPPSRPSSPGAPAVRRLATVLGRTAVARRSPYRRGRQRHWRSVGRNSTRAIGSLPVMRGAYIIPALIAEAEATGAPTADVIASLAVAYEVTARIAHAFPAQPLRVHPHGAFAPLGAAAGLARLRGYATKDFAAALSSAMSMSHAGPYSHAPAGALARNAWTATGAWAGYRAADWAPIGIGGLPETIFDVMATCYGHEALPDRLTADLGTSWAVSSGYHKMIACCQYAHSAVEATLRLRAEIPALKDPANIAAIVVATHPMGETLATPEPETVLAGKFSMLHAVATTVVHGSAGAGAFARGSLSDPQVTALRSRIRLVPHEDLKPWPKDRPARVEVTLTDGSRGAVSIDSARGGPDDPFSEAELRGQDRGADRGPLSGHGGKGLSGLTTSQKRWADDVAAMVAQPN